MDSTTCKICKSSAAKFGSKKSETPTHCKKCSELDMVHTHTHRLFVDYFATHGTAHMQIDSYNNLITTGLQRIVNETPEIVVPHQKGVKYVYTFGQVYVDTPKIACDDRSLRPLLPNEARLRDLTYESAVCLDVTSQMYDNERLVDTKLAQRVIVGYIPTMLNSVICNLYNKNERNKIEAKECTFDQGGYFVVNGKERVIIFQQRPNYNFVQVIEQPMTTSTKYKYIAEIRSIAEESGYSVVVRAMISLSGKGIYFSLPNIKEEIPAGIVLKALGVIENSDIEKIINMTFENGKKYIKYILYDSAHIKTREEAIAYIGKYPMYAIQKDKQTAYAKQIVEMELFPHLGITATLADKASFLGYMLHKLISTMIGVRRDDDRDNIANKRFETSGALIGELFRSMFSNLVKSLSFDTTICYH